MQKKFHAVHLENSGAQNELKSFISVKQLHSENQK